MFPFLEVQQKKTVDIGVRVDHDTAASITIVGPVTTAAKDNLIRLIQALPTTVPEVIPVLPDTNTTTLKEGAATQ